MRSYYLLEAIADEFDVDLVCIVQDKLLESYFPSLEFGLEVASEKLNSFCNDVKFFSMDHRNRTIDKVCLAAKCLIGKKAYSVEWHASSAMETYLSSLSDMANYELVHFDTLALAKYVDYFKDTKKVLDHHNIESSMMLTRSRKTKNKLLSSYLYLEYLNILRAEDHVCSLFSAHISCSKGDADYLKRKYPIPLSIEIENLVDISDGNFTRTVTQSEVRGLFIGGLDWYPNRDAAHHFLTELIDPISAAVPHFSIDIIGKNPDPELRDLAEGYSNVTLHGFVEDLQQFYAQSDFFICTIRDGGGTKLKVIDAMAKRQTVIGYPEAFDGLAVTDGFNALICNSPDELVKKLKHYSTKKQELQDIGNRAREYIVKKHSTQVVGHKIKKLYSEIIETERI